MSVRIVWQSSDGEEHDESWPSIERFRLWARSERLRVAWSAFTSDDDEWVLIDSGTITA